MNHPILKQILALFFISNFLLSPILTVAQADPVVVEEPAASSLLVGPPAPPVPVGEIDPENFLRPPVTAARLASQDPKANLEEWREQDREACELEAKGSKKKNPTVGQAVAGAVTKPLKESINEQLGINAIPTALNQTINESAALAIEQDLQTEFKAGFEQRLKEELPLTLAEKLEAARATGLTDADIRANRGLFTSLVRDSIRESLPRVLNEDFVGNAVSNSVDRGLRNSLQNNLRLNFGRVARPTVETYYRAQIETVLAQVPGMIEKEVKHIEDTIRGTMAGLEYLKTQAAECLGDPLCIGTRALTAGLTVRVDPEEPFGLVQGLADSLFPEINQAITLLKNMVEQLDGITKFLTWLTEFLDTDNQDAFVEQMITKLSLQLEQSLTEPKNIARLADAITGAISGPINRQLESSIDQVMDSIVGPTRALEDAIDSMDEVFLDPIIDAVDLQISMTVAQLTKPAVIIIDHIGDTIAMSIDNTLGQALYPLAQGITMGAFEAGSWVADGINSVGYGIQDAIFPRPEISVVPDDFNGPIGPGQVPQGQFDLMQQEGIRIVPDSIATLRPGEMRWSDYQAALPPHAPLTGALGDISSTAAETTQASVGQVTEQAVGSVGVQSGLTSNIAQGLKGGLVGTFTAGVTSVLEGVPYVGPILAQVAEQVLAETMSTIGMAPAAGGFPVMDVGVLWSSKGILSVEQGISRTSGKILSEEKKISDLTEKLLNLQIQACTNSKVIRRVQILAEDRMFIWNPAARKASAKAISEHKDRWITDFFNHGYEVSAAALNVPGATGEKKPLYVQNTATHLAEVQNEQKRILIEQLKGLAEDEANYPLVQEIYNKLSQEPDETFAERLKPTLTKEEFDEITTVGKFSDAADPWGNWLKLIQPQNNPAGVENLTREELARRAAEADQNAREELAWGQGVLGPRECAAEDQLENGDCAKWKTTVPAPTVRDYFTSLMTSITRQLEGADESSEDAVKRELPNIEAEFSAGLDAYADTARGSIFNSQDPCPGPGPCQDSGWNI
ncbi:MAG: hypothetical protein AAB455_00160 [Patescibacteria group bacterium]